MEKWEEITSLVRIAIFDRPNFSLKSLAADMPRRFSGNRLREREGLLLKYKNPSLDFFHSNLNHISATKIRSQMKTNRIGD